VLDGDGVLEGVADGDGVGLGPVDPGERPAEAEAVALALVRGWPGDGLPPGCPPLGRPLAAVEVGPWELPGCADRAARDAAADADWLASPPDPAASWADCAVGLDPNGLKRIVPAAISATAATDRAAMVIVRLRGAGRAGTAPEVGADCALRALRAVRAARAARRPGGVASGGRSAVMGVVWTACSGSGHSCGPGTHPGD
jgi:hypothetical protein